MGLAFSVVVFWARLLMEVSVGTVVEHTSIG
jgi:hypothetical protein